MKKPRTSLLSPVFFLSCCDEVEKVKIEVRLVSVGVVEEGNCFVECSSSGELNEEIRRSISLNLVCMRSMVREVSERITSKFSMRSLPDRAIFRSRISEVKSWAKKRGCLRVVVRRTVRDLKKNL